MTIKVIKTANPDYVQAMQGRRRSSAAQPHRNKTKYTRKVKHRKGRNNEDSMG